MRDNSSTGSSTGSSNGRSTARLAREPDLPSPETGENLDKNWPDLRIDKAHSSPVVEESFEETVIEASSGWPSLDLLGLWRYRELLVQLAWRDVQVRYKQTVLGGAWAIIQPTMMMLVFTLFLGKFAKFSTGNIPGPVFFYAGFLPWTLFSTGLSRSGNSVVGSSSLITKIYFPRLIVPFASIGPAIVDFVIAIAVLFLLMAWYGIAPTVSILFAPLAVGLIVMGALAGGLVLAALNVSYRDFRYVIPFLVQLWMFATPAIFMDTTSATPSRETPVAESTDTPEAKTGSNISPAMRCFMVMNPLNGAIAFFRASTLGQPLPWTGLATSATIIFSVFFASLYNFRRLEDSFADVI